MKKARRLSDAQLSVLFGEYAVLVASGLDAGECAGIISMEEPGRDVKAALESIGETCASGAPLWEAFEKCGAIPRYACDSLRVGETTGRLEETLSALSGWYSRRDRTVRAIRAAVSYPLLLTVLMLAVLVVLVTRVLPVFADMAAQLGVSLSPAARLFLDAGRFISDNALPLAAAVVAAAAVIIAVIAAATKRFASDKLVAARFSSAMALASASGLQSDEALELASRLAGSGAGERKTAEVKAKLAEGASLSEAVASSDLLPPADAHLLSIAERAGKIDAVFAQIAERSERAYADSIDDAVARIEPTLVIIMCVLVGAILFSVMLPLLGVLTAL